MALQTTCRLATPLWQFPDLHKIAQQLCSSIVAPGCDSVELWLVSTVIAGVGYTVTGSLSLTAVKRSICFHGHGGDPQADCTFANNPWLLFFGGLQLM